ncbi:uncharacterized protein DS421_2g37390 [Arachis hypogaea]|nr:uncharacterized protein DS421_2g37390 [Arachis hypogaea]
MLIRNNYTKKYTEGGGKKFPVFHLATAKQVCRRRIPSCAATSAATASRNAARNLRSELGSARNTAVTTLPRAIAADPSSFLPRRAFASHPQFLKPIPPHPRFAKSLTSAPPCTSMWVAESCSCHSCFSHRRQSFLSPRSCMKPLHRPPPCVNLSYRSLSAPITGSFFHIDLSFLFSFLVHNLLYLLLIGVNYCCLELGI